jgi:2-polyprenyl-3-methyl-5-hydroxy-6-metoxy-1,4-benzoquinol methylase
VPRGRLSHALELASPSLHATITGTAGWLSPSIRRELARDLATDDPWSLDSNPFERQRHELMLRMLDDGRTYNRALEVGCAAVAFTAALAKRSATLHVIDAMPEAIDRCRARLGHAPNVTYAVADIGNSRGVGHAYDLIVVAEVLYYLESRQRIAAGVRKLAGWLRPGGIVVFCSLVDAVAARSRLGGAETTMLEWERVLDEVARCSSVGAGLEHHSLIVKYERPASQATARRIASCPPTAYLYPPVDCDPAV